MKLFPQLAILVVILQLASCAHQAWENIKHWYKDMDYNKDAAEEMVALGRRVSSRYVGSAEGFCYEEFLFRNSYRLIGLSLDDKFYTVRGLNRIEYFLLNLKTEFHKKFQRNQVHMNTKLFERVMACDSFSFVPREELREMFFERKINNACKFMNDEDKEKIGAIMDCVKQKLTPDP